jgi:pimeloyl-ACP methyl ester carboxylesterase
MRLHLQHVLALALSTTLALSRAVSYSQHQTPILHHAATNRTVSATLFSELEELARIVDISYCVGLTSLGIAKPFTCLSRCKDFPAFELVTTWNTGPMLSDSCGYIALDHGKRRVIVAFRGTYSVANTVVDLSTVPQEYVPYPEDGDDEREGDGEKCRNCTVHMGFHTAWIHTRNRILEGLLQQMILYPEYELNLVGHSLGAAVAALAALDLQGRGFEPMVTTFGEPRVGNKGLAEFLDKRFHLISTDEIDEDDTEMRYRRVTHVNDPVPLLPLSEWSFAMHAGEIYISKSSLSPDISDLEHCVGDNDQTCIAGADGTTSSTLDSRSSAQKRDLIASVKDEIHDVVHEPWGIPSRYKLWQLFFAHRDYFWRLGLCVPGGDPLGGGEKYDNRDELKIELR